MDKKFEEILEKGAQVDPIFREEVLLDEGAVSTSVRLAALEEIFSYVNSDDDFKTVAAKILAVATKHIPSEAGSFFEIDYKNRDIFFRAIFGKTSDGLLNVSVPLGAGIVGRVCETQKTEVLSQMKDNSVHLKNIGLLVGFDAKDVVACPVVIRGVTFGCIELLNRNGSDKYSQSDIEILESICKYAAKVIENRLVVAELYRRFSAQPAKQAA